MNEQPPKKQVSHYTQSAHDVRAAEVALWVALMSAGAPAPYSDGGPEDWIPRDRAREKILAAFEKATDPDVRRSGILYKRALDRCVRANSGLVYQVAHRLQKKGAAVGLELLDLVQEGNIGLMRALEKYDPRRGVSFATYAYFWIYQTTNRTIDNSGIIRIPVGRQTRKDSKDESKKVRRDYIQCADNARRVGSLDEPVDNSRAAGDMQTVLDHISDSSIPPADVAMGLREDISTLLDAMDDLDPRERRIVRARYVEEKTLEEVGEENGITRERIRQIEQQLLRKLRDLIEPEGVNLT